jgi:hypothetical protein
VNSTTGRLFIATPVGLGTAETQDLEVGVAEEVGNLGVLNFGADCVGA